MATTYSFATLAERLVRALWGGRYVIPKDSLNSTSSTTSLVIDGGPVTGLSDFVYSSASANEFDGATVYIPAHATSVTAPEGEFSRVTRGGYTGSTGTLTLSGALSADPNLITSGGKLLFMFGLTPWDFLEAANEIIRSLHLPRFLPLGYISDGDMEFSSAAGWSQVGSATLAKDTDTTILGARSLSIVADTDNGATSASFPAQEGEQWHISAMVKCSVGSLRVQFYDVTNGAEIFGATVNELEFTEVRFDATVPDNCEAVSIRLLAKTTPSTVYVNWATGFPERPMFDLTLSTVLSTVDAHDIMGVYTQREGHPSEAADSYAPFAERLTNHALYSPVTDYYAGISHWLQINRPVRAPLFVQFRHTGTALTGLNADADEVIYVPQEIMVEGCLAELYDRLATKTRNPRQLEKYGKKSAQHKRTYRQLLNAIDLGQPEVRYVPTQRVAVP